MRFACLSAVLWAGALLPASPAFSNVQTLTGAVENGSFTQTLNLATATQYRISTTFDFAPISVDILGVMGFGFEYIEMRDGVLIEYTAEYYYDLATPDYRAALVGSRITAYLSSPRDSFGIRYDGPGDYRSERFYYGDVRLITNARFASRTPFAYQTVIVDLGAVPEPATWAMLILGFGAIGVAARRRNPSGHLAKGPKQLA